MLTKSAKSDKHVMAYYERLERRVWFCVREERCSPLLQTGGAQGPRRKHFRGLFYRSNQSFVSHWSLSRSIIITLLHIVLSSGGERSWEGW